MSGAGVPRGLRPLAEVRDELGADRLTKELAEGRWVGYWHFVDRDELREISQAHWQDGREARSTMMRSGPYVELHDSPKFGLRKRAVFVAPAAESPTRHPGGRPAEHDWEGVLVHMVWHIHENGVPKTQAELVRIMHDWFDGKHGKIPADSDLKKRARRIFQAFGR